MKKKMLLPILFGVIISYTAQGQLIKKRMEKYRPQIHFSPEAHWMNDPNGMVYYKGKYHLFYQYFPGASVWGPMHWAHATSTDLIHWDSQPVALYPDSLGYIFSGSAVVDEHNTSCLGKEGKPPLVAIFTHHNPDGEKAKTNDFQNQSLAYSLDEGKTWTKYAENPVLRNPGITDFRDPKVMWYEQGEKWVMTLATKDRITFYSSPDLKNWSKESEFGAHIGAHGGVWECPDLFPLMMDGKIYWVLIVNINPGAPNGGSGAQYFIGGFDGKTFTPLTNETRWIDYGTDNYAGITWSNTGKRKIFIGWMNNWWYADKVPTETWRGATTLPRELKLLKSNYEIVLASEPIKELEKIELKPLVSSNLAVNGNVKLFAKQQLNSPFKLQIKGDQLKSFNLSIENDLGENLTVGYDVKTNHYYIDRSKSGKIDFNPSFSKIQEAPRISSDKAMDLILFIDVASVELFADDGRTVMTSVFFPGKPMNRLQYHTDSLVTLKEVRYTPLKSIWSGKK